MVQIITNNSGGGGGVGAYKYKGSVNTYEDLPTSGMKIGDVYNVIEEHTTEPQFPAGANVAWTGTGWDVLGGTFDLSDYQKKLAEGVGINIDENDEISVDTLVIATQTDLANGLATKQDVISDLDTIRSNANAGKNASDTISTYGNIVTHNVNEFATSAQGALADTAVQPGDNVSELNNDSGFITSADLPDLTPYQLKSNMVTSLNSADDDHYPTAKAVKDAITSSGCGDVSGPSSSVDGHLAVFDGATGKLIKDGGAIPTPTTVVDNLTTQSATSALSANQGYVLKGITDTINGKIPSAATTSNQLADKNYVDNSINSVAAYYITKNASGAQFATYAELVAATTFYSGGVVRTPTRNDYTIVLDDETHNDEVTRYIYNNGWEYQYTINESPLTQAQLDALNSGITSGKVTSYDSVVSTIATYGNIVTHNTSEFATSAQGAKADTALQPNDNISELNNDAGYITGVNWGDIGGSISNQTDLNNNLNTKTFVLASASDTATAQQAYNWYAAGKNPILSLNGRSYSLYSVSTSLMVFQGGTSNGNGTSYTTLTESIINVELSSGTVTSVSSGTSSASLLSPTVNYGTPFTPTQNGHPATKKYVDDSISGIAYPVTSVNGQTGTVVLDSDDVSQGSTNLYVTSAEKSDWNGKQDALTQGTGISISGNTISNTGVTSVNGQTGAATVSEFSPDNAGNTDEVLTKTATGYQWAAPSGGGGMSYTYIATYGNDSSGGRYQVDLSAYEWVLLIFMDGSKNRRYSNIVPTALLTEGGSFGHPASNSWRSTSITGTSTDAITFNTPRYGRVAIYGITFG